MSQASLWTANSDLGPIVHPIDAALEVGAYEVLWADQNATFNSLAERFAKAPGARPSVLVPQGEARKVAARVLARLRQTTETRFDVRVHGEVDYPERLRDATHPVELLYFQGAWELITTRAVAVVGTRKPTGEGVKRTQQLARKLVEDGFTVVSGLAEGVDTAAHTSAIEAGGQTIAVIGTPLGHVYPKANADLQDRIARDYLLISQVPVERYESQNYRVNRFFFPERNKTMAALTEATIIVEAGETSGTLVQARSVEAEAQALHPQQLLRAQRPELAAPVRAGRRDPRSGLCRHSTRAGRVTPQSCIRSGSLGPANRRHVGRNRRRSGFHRERHCRRGCDRGHRSGAGSAHFLGVPDQDGDASLCQVGPL